MVTVLILLGSAVVGVAVGVAAVWWQMVHAEDRLAPF
jgi:hypothetical protein